MVATARERLITSAITLTQEKGVAGTTVADLLASSGVARRSLYLNFDGGRDEVLAVAGRTAAEFLTAGVAAAISRATSPSEAVRAIIAPFRDQLVASGYASGCPINAAGLGGADLPQTRDMAGETFASWCSMIVDAMVERGADREEAERAATLVVAAFEGALAMGVAGRTTRYLDHVEQSLGRLLDDLVA